MILHQRAYNDVCSQRSVHCELSRAAAEAIPADTTAAAAARHSRIVYDASIIDDNC